MLVATFISLSMGCASQPSDTNQPGSCKLDCSNRVVPSSQMKLYAMTGDSEITCFGDSGNNDTFDLNRPVTVRFRAVLESNEGQEGGAEEAGGGEGLAQDASVFENQHVGGVGFEPWVIGGVSVANTNEEHRIEVNGQIQAEPSKFAGIVTPKSEWCSDSCGVMTYEVWPICITGKDNAVTGSVLAGAAQVDKPIVLSINHDSGG
jgi:hypothetical protein